MMKQLDFFPVLRSADRWSAACRAADRRSAACRAAARRRFAALRFANLLSGGAACTLLLRVAALAFATLPPAFAAFSGQPAFAAKAASGAPATAAKAARSAAGDLIIVNNSPEKTQTVTATALTPSKASELRRAREDAEVSTESYILEKLEAKRLKEEQKLADSLMGKDAEEEEEAVAAPPPAAPVSPQWYFGEKAFVSLGGGIVRYLGADNVESNEPAFFISLGGYGLSRVIFDFTGYGSRHFIGAGSHGDISSYGYETQVIQLSGALSLKFSPLKGRFKPYAGATAVITGRNYCYIDYYENSCIVHDPQGRWDRRGQKEWEIAFDVGPSVGADIALGPRLGINVNFSWLFNTYTEERKDYYHPYIYAEDLDLLSEKPSVVLSGNIRFYF